MARPRSKHPTDGELEILRVLWTNGKCGLSTVCEHLRQEREVATTTVATMLKVMLEKGLVKRSSSTRGYEWSARVSRESTASSLIGKLVDGVFDGSAEQLVAHLVETDRLTSQELDELKKLVSGKSQRASTKKGKRN